MPETEEDRWCCIYREDQDAIFRKSKYRQSFCILSFLGQSQPPYGEPGNGIPFVYACDEKARPDHFCLHTRVPVIVGPERSRFAAPARHHDNNFAGPGGAAFP